MALSTSRLINVDVQLNSLAASMRGFGTLLVIGDSDVLSNLEAMRSYTNLNDVANDFGVTSAEYLAAQAYFSQQPAPDNLMIGRWYRQASAAELMGGILTDSEQQITNFNTVNNGAFKYTINNEVRTVRGVDLTGQTNLNGVSSVISSTLQGAKLAFDGQRFIVDSEAEGAGITLGYFAADDELVDASSALGLTMAAGAQTKTGTDVIPGTPGSPEEPATSGTLTGGNINLATLRRITNGQISINLNGSVNPVVLTNLDFSGVRIVSDIPALLTLQGAKVIADGEHLVITSDTLGKQSAVSYATAGVITQAQDLSKLFKLTSDLALAPTPGTDDESALAALQRLTNASADWYGAMFAASEMPSDDDLLECAEFTEGQNDITRVFGITATDTRTLDSSWKQDIASRCKEKGLSRTVVQYSQNPYAIASFFGRAFTVNFNGNMTTITMMYKSEPSIAAETITETQAQTLEAKRCNVFVNYNNNTSIIQYGVTSGDYWWDERHGSDWLKEYIGNSVWNLFMTANTKIGQDDAGVNKIVSVINESLVQAKSNGFVGAGTWNGDGFGQLTKGDYLNDGFYIYAPPMSTQSQADREQRISVPIQVAAKLLGAIHTVDVAVNLNR